MVNKKIQKQEEIIDYYYNPNVECTCGAIFADTHRGYCKRRVRPEKELFMRTKR
jgi:hypothetical protein